MNQSSTEDDLVAMLKSALSIADGLALWSVAARLDQALIQLTGNGIATDEGPTPETRH